VNWCHILICNLIHPNSSHLSLTYRINGDKGIKPALSILKNIIEKGFQDQTPGSKLIWIILLNKHSKKMNYLTAEQRSINRNIPNRRKGQGIYAPQAHQTFIRRYFYPPFFWRDGGLLRRIEILNHDSFLFLN
jgi:hypothetical protein